MQSTNVLSNIREGMKVLDSSNRQIGTVETVRFGDDDPSTVEPEAREVNPGDRQTHRSLIEAVADVFRSDGLPEEVQEKLLLQGFVRIDADGLLASDRYVTPDQIAGVSSDALTLRVSKDALLKRH